MTRRADMMAGQLQKGRDTMMTTAIVSMLQDADLPDCGAQKLINQSVPMPASLVSGVNRAARFIAPLI
jgi:hypothetical protein